MSGAELMQVSPSCPFRVNARSTFCTHSAAAHARVWQVRRHVRLRKQEPAVQQQPQHLVPPKLGPNVQPKRAS